MSSQTPEELDAVADSCEEAISYTLGEIQKLQDLITYYEWRRDTYRDAAAKAREKDSNEQN
jgi:hypothetical protein